LLHLFANSAATITPIVALLLGIPISTCLNLMLVNGGVHLDNSGGYCSLKLRECRYIAVDPDKVSPKK